MKKLLIFLLILAALLLVGAVIIFFLLAPSRTETFSPETEFTMNLTSPAFTQGQPIPVKFSCKGADVSPTLAWDEPPAGTKSLALVMDDPDAPMGTWVHWVLFNIPTTAHEWPENTPTDANLPNGAVQGLTSARSVGYHGPCPPSGTHRYFFKLYALDIKLDLTSKADKQALLNAMQGHILAQGELMGTFSK